MRFLRTNTAVRVTVGPFFDKTDGVTPEVALTVTGIKLTLMVDDANVPTLVLDTNPTASGGANDMVHVTGDDAGFYDLELAAANVNYLGRAMLALTDAANHCPVFHEFMILPAMVYDSLILGTDDLDTNTKKWNDLTTVALPLIPTTAGRALDVSAGGEAGVDWANVGSPTTVVGLSGTTVKTATDVETDTADIQTRLPAALTAGGHMKSDALAISGDTVAADNAEAFFDGTGYAGTGNTIPTVTTVGTVTALAAGAVISGAHAAAELNAIADAILDRNMATGTDSGTNSTVTRTVRQALRRLRNKESIAGGTLTVTKEDDATSSWTAAVTTTAGDPLSAVDPT